MPLKSHSKSKATIKRDEEAKKRLAARNSRSDEQQLAILETRGAGRCREAVRIRARLAKQGDPGTDLQNVEALEALKERNKKSRPARKRRAVPASLM